MTKRSMGAVKRWRCAALCLLAGSGSVLASAPPWTDAPYSHYANATHLESVLKEFASNFSLALKLNAGVSGTVNGRFNARNPTEFINKLGSVYGFNWFTHAGTLFVSRADDLQTKAIPSGYNSTSQLHDALTSLGILDPRFGWGDLPDQGIAMVSGPPAYVDLVERMVKSLPSIAGGQQVAVYRLKHASVDDRTVIFRDKEIVTPGIATILRNLITGGGGGGGGRSGVNSEAMSSAGIQVRAAAPVVTEVNGANSGSLPAAQSFPVSSSGGAGPVPGASPPATARSAGGTRTRTPSIQADVRLNSLIVQDIPERLPVYEALIRELDVPTALIEIQAMIVDVNSQFMTELGIDWGMRTGSSGVGYNTPTSTSAGSTPALAFNWAAVKGIADPTTLSVSAGNYLVTRLRALEGAGVANIQNRRSVLTLDNLGALFEHSETFYIRVQGERVATVTPISAGTTLKVTPRVIASAGKNVIQLLVDVEDGNIQDKLIDQLPTVMKSGLSTQALVNEGHTLSVGGYSREQTIERVDRVPVLGEIPLFGLLFSNKTTDRQKRQRLFLIKPKVVAMPDGDTIVIPDDADEVSAMIKSPEGGGKKEP